jgi:hypothetical protein
MRRRPVLVLISALVLTACIAEAVSTTTTTTTGGTVPMVKGA